MNLPKNVCLFHQGSIPDCCYILIKGNLSVRYSNIDDDTEPVDLDDLRILKLKVANEYNISHHFKCRNMMSSSLNYDEKEKVNDYHIINKTPERNCNNYNNNYEEEILEISDQCIFISDNNLINKQPHTTSLYTKSNCLLLCLEKKDFCNSLLKNLSSFDSNMKLFILNHIKTFQKLPSNIFNYHYSKIEKLYPQINDEIFISSFSKNNKSFYLIFKGTCAAKSLHPIKYDRGNFFGLESLQSKKDYNYTVKVVEVNTILFKFNVEYFNHSISELKSELLPLLEKQKEIATEYIQKAKDIAQIFNIKSKLKLLKVNNKGLCKKLLNAEHNQEEKCNLLKVKNTFVSNSAKNIFEKKRKNRTVSKNKLKVNISKTTTKIPYIQLSNRKTIENYENVNQTFRQNLNVTTFSKVNCSISKIYQPKLKNKMYLNFTTDKENSNIFLNTSYKVGCPSTTRSTMRNLVLGKKKYISLRKNLGPLFEKSCSLNKNHPKICKEVIENNKTVVYYETQNYNIPLAHTLIKEQ